jgi:hypothetical protein
VLPAVDNDRAKNQTVRQFGNTLDLVRRLFAEAMSVPDPRSGTCARPLSPPPLAGPSNCSIQVSLVRSDFTGDRQSDLLWHHAMQGDV